MWKLIFLGLFIWLVFQIFKRIMLQSDDNKPENDNQDLQNEDLELMVKCEKCAVHLPRSEAFMAAGDFYCSKAHLPPK